MTTVCKCTITRPSLDSLFVFELPVYGESYPDPEMIIIDKNSGDITIEANYVVKALHADTFILESKLSLGSPKIILQRYEEFISWDELIERKNELRPDIRHRLDHFGILDRTTNLNSYGEGPNFNPFSLTHTRNAVYETFEDWELNYNYYNYYNYYFNNLNPKNANDRLKNSLNTVQEELYIDGILTEYKNFKQLY